METTKMKYFKITSKIAENFKATLVSETNYDETSLQNYRSISGNSKDACHIRIQVNTRNG